jgi:uncharacterized protein YecE (DUF72 family)
MKVGLCGWTISQREYFERFPVVEVQQTFYEPPPRSTLLRWKESAPPGFEFTLKAWQVITHTGTSMTYRRMKRKLDATEARDCGAFQWTPVVREAWKTTVDCAKVLGATMVLFQCPASFKQSDENISRMQRFFREADRNSLRFLWEPRGTSWQADVIADMCRELDLVHVVDPFVDSTVTPEFIYFRLHGRGGHRYVYTDAELRQLYAMIPPDVPAYVMFNNIPRDGDSERFMRMARRGAL